jgi:hypothetical protein
MAEDQWLLVLWQDSHRISKARLRVWNLKTGQQYVKSFDTYPGSVSIYEATYEHIIVYTINISNSRDKYPEWSLYRFTHNGQISRLHRGECQHNCDLRYLVFTLTPGFPYVHVKVINMDYSTITFIHKIVLSKKLNVQENTITSLISPKATNMSSASYHNQLFTMYEGKLVLSDKIN